MNQCHILLVAFPGQGLINPALQFAKRLVGMGVKVTFMTAFSALNSMTKTIPTPQGLSVVGFSDGYDDGFKAGYDRRHYLFQLKRLGSEAIKELITDSTADKGRPFTHLVYTSLLSWVGEVAHNLRFPSTLLWVQPATVLDIYYYYSNGYTDDIQNITKDSSLSIQLPGLPTLTSIDLPSFMIPSDFSPVGLSFFTKHIEILDAETKPKVLVNTFDALEAEAVGAINKLNLIPIGPLIPSAFLDEKDPSDTCFGADIFQKSSDHNEFLNSKPDGSVVYVSFGSVCPISKQQLEEIARGLLESHRPFLWVIRAERSREKEGEEEEEQLSCMEELEKQGMIVSWCSQVEVLSHPSLGCFVSHCGWNSSLESLVCGVPVVGFPQWSDQGTNAKLINDVWKTGVRVTKNGGGFVKGEEIARCIDLVMGDGDRAEEMRRNAKKWRDLAREAVKDGGSSDMNLKAFLNEIGN